MRFYQFVIADRAPIDRTIIDFRSRSRKRYRASCHPREMLFTPLTRLVSFGGAPCPGCWPFGYLRHDR